MKYKTSQPRVLVATAALKTTPVSILISAVALWMLAFMVTL